MKIEPKGKMLSIVDGYRSSGMTQKEFCKKAGVGIAKLKYWVGKSAEMAVAARFIALTPGIRNELTMEYPSGVVINVDASDLSSIARLAEL